MTMEGWAAIQTFTGAASAEHPFYRADGRPAASCVFLGEPVALVVDQSSTAYSLATNPTGEDLANTHLLINAYISELGAVKVVAGNARFLLRMLQHHFETGLATKSFSLEMANVRHRDLDLYTGPLVSVKLAGEANVDNLKGLTLHDLHDTACTTAYLALLQSERDELRKNDQTPHN